MRSSSPRRRSARTAPRPCRAGAAGRRHRCRRHTSRRSRLRPARSRTTSERRAVACRRPTRSARVNSGPSAKVTSTFATVVSVSATMYAVNITIQHRPETHSAPPPSRHRVPHDARPAHPAQHPGQRQCGRQAAPERHLETGRRVQVPRDHSRQRSTSTWRRPWPEQRDDGSWVSEGRAADRASFELEPPPGGGQGVHHQMQEEGRAGVGVKPTRATPFSCRVPSGGACGSGSTSA